MARKADIHPSHELYSQSFLLENFISQSRDESCLFNEKKKLDSTLWFGWKPPTNDLKL